MEDFNQDGIWPAALGHDEESREEINVGSIRRLSHFQGQVVGDDVVWRGSSISRIVCIQTAGSGGCLAEWGRWWAEAFQELGADIGILSETRIRSAAQHSQVVRGMEECGFGTFNQRSISKHGRT